MHSLPGGIGTMWTFAAVASFAGIARAQQPLETETARLPNRGIVLIGPAYEVQTSSVGTEHALPFAFEYGLADRLAILIEPVFFTAIRPKVGRRATGPGDLEATLQFLARGETPSMPALAIAAEVKLPTATDTLIGTRKADFTPYVIASKRFGGIDTHANVGFSFIGKPGNVQVQNTINAAFALEHHVSPAFDLVSEVLSTSAAGTGAPEGSSAPEIGGAELVAMIGFRYAMRPRSAFSFGVTWDNANALLFRPGFTIESPF